MKKYRILDLFCKIGGAATTFKQYEINGFELIEQ